MTETGINHFRTQRKSTEFPYFARSKLDAGCPTERVSSRVIVTKRLSKPLDDKILVSLTGHFN